MPLRGLFYFSQLYQKYLAQEDLDLQRPSIVKIPNPHFVVFYNGQPERPERYKLRLSDAFELEDKSGDFEWTAEVVNINPNKNESLVKSCKPMYDYVRLVGKISANKKKEIIGMYLTEYNEERAIRNWRQDGIEEGRQEKAVEDARNMLKKDYPTSDIIEITGLSLEQVIELQKELAEAPAN